MQRATSFAFALIVVLAGCGAGFSSMTGTPGDPYAGARDGASDAGSCAGQTPPPTPSPAARARRATGAQKTPIAGLIDLGQVSANDMHEPPYNTVYYACQRPESISGIVVNDTWAALQPNGAGEAIDTTPIDRALKTIRAYNATPGHALGVRLRIWAGIDAPAWAQSIGGAPIVICDSTAVPTAAGSPTASPSASPDAHPDASPTPCPQVAQRTVGRFWSTAYSVAWRHLQAQLAQKYDNDPAVDEVSVSSCSSLTSEPFVQPEDAFSRVNLEAGGYSDAAYQRCLSHAIATDYAAWHTTPLDYSFNPFRMIQPIPPQTDLAFTEATIASCRAAIGSRCVLLDEALAKFTPPPSPAPSQTPSQAQSYYLMWQYMKAQGGDITFQTASPPNLLSAWGTNLAGWNAAVQLAHTFGATSLELFPPKNTAPCTMPPQRLWVNGYTCFPKKTLLGWRTTLRPAVSGRY